MGALLEHVKDYEEAYSLLLKVSYSGCREQCPITKKKAYGVYSKWYLGKCQTFVKNSDPG